MYRSLAFFFCLMILSTPLWAATIYKSIDGNGNVVYSEIPDKQAEKIVIPEIKRKKPQNEPDWRAILQRPLKKEPAKPVLSKILIISPEHDQGIRSNNGQLDIKTRVEPLFSPQHHQLHIFLDGEDKGIYEQTQIKLLDISRGSHTLEIKLLDKKSKKILASESTLFHLLRARIN